MNTEYVEPVNFKGTKGVFYFTSDAIFSDGEMVANLSKSNKNYLKERNENLANAILLSQSKQMAKALQEIIKYFDSHSQPIVLEDREMIISAKEVLNKALNINQ